MENKDDAILLDAMLQKGLLVIQKLGSAYDIVVNGGFLGRAAQALINLLSRFGLTRAVQTMTAFVTNPFVVIVLGIVEFLGLPWVFDRLLGALQRLARFVTSRVQYMTGTSSSRAIEGHPHQQ